MNFADESYPDEKPGFIFASTLRFSMKRFSTWISVDEKSERCTLDAEALHQGAKRSIEHITKDGKSLSFPATWAVTIGIGPPAPGGGDRLFVGSLGSQLGDTGYCMVLLASKELFENIARRAHSITESQLSIISRDIAVCGDGSVLRWNQKKRDVLKVSAWELTF
jgi:hypothetical protein